MNLHCTVLVRVFGVSLLVLAISPVTAPFSTCDLIDLLSGGSRPAGAILQSKPAPDEGTADVSRGASRDILWHQSARPATLTTVHGCRPATLHLQLRI